MLLDNEKKELEGVDTTVMPRSMVHPDAYKGLTLLQSAKYLWDLLDDIDSASDMFKPRTVEEYQVYVTHIYKKLDERFKIFMSDGYELFYADTGTKS